MMPVSTKLTLLVLAIPIASIVSVFVVGFYFYRESFDASAFSTAVSSLLSAILVILLVWERLRDSLSKKLEYLHKNSLFKLYCEFRRPSLFWTRDEIARLMSDLKRYGEFLILDLYPRNLPRDINEFLTLQGEFYKRYMKIEELFKKQVVNPANLHSDLLQNYVGLKPDYVNLSSYTVEVKQEYEEIARRTSKENSQLVSETKDFLEKTRKLCAQVFEKLEDFLKSNNLRLEEETAWR